MRRASASCPMTIANLSAFLHAAEKSDAHNIDSTGISSSTSRFRGWRNCQDRHRRLTNDTLR